MKKALKWMLIALVALIVVPLVLLVVVNLFDEDLDPRAAAYGEPRAATVPEAENAYFALIALNASDGADGMAYARAWHNEVKTAAIEKRKEKLPESKRAQRPSLCEPRETACFALARDKAGEVSQQLDAYQEDLARYETVLGYRRFEEMLDFPTRADSSFPPYAPVAAAQRAYLLRAGLAVEAGKMEKAIAALERDFAFQRMLLGSARTLIGKMIAAANYWRDLQFINELIQTRPAELAPFLPAMRKWLWPLDNAALSMASTTEVEFGFVKSVLRDGLVGKGENALGVPLEDIMVLFFFKRNASLNRSYRYYSGVSSVLSAPADRLQAEMGTFVKQWSGAPEWNWIYNPVGKILQGVAAPAFDDYALRLHDLDGLSRLIALRVDMLAAGVNAELAPEFIAKSDVRLHNPYTRKPMNWDAEKKRIYFDAKSTGTKRFKNGVENGRVYVAL